MAHELLVTNAVRFSPSNFKLRQWRVTEPSVTCLLGIGVIDMIATATLHAQGKIVELNPMMSPVIERGEWLFVAIKSATLVAGGIVLNKLAKKHPSFVPQACYVASAVYVGVWSYAFMQGA